MQRPLATCSAADFIPPDPSLEELREASMGCRGCHLWTVDTQTVFGEGRATARMLLVGEQPGDQEDRSGRPFVGPAGRLLDRALEEAGIARNDAYVTNAVKHFKWVRGDGKRRIHKTPNDGEVRACTPWLEMEVALVQPRVIVALGATAGKALLGKDFRVTRERGRAIPVSFAEAVVATIHPSAVLRAPDAAAREIAERGLVDDLRTAARLLE